MVLFNGDGRDWPGEILPDSTDRTCRVRLGEPLENHSESPLRVHLVQGICRSEKMDWALQKATELGVVHLWPVMTERTQVRLSGDRARKRTAHWEGVVTSACEQSGRARVPRVEPPAALEQILEQLPGAGLRVHLDTDRAPALSEENLASRVSEGPVVIAVGPEGGLGPSDLRLLESAGFRPARLGPRILRSETAGPAALAVLQALYGDMA